MSHVTPMKLLLAHTWTISILHMYESFQTQMHESCSTHQWVVSHIWMSVVVHMSKSCTNESCPAHTCHAHACTCVCVYLHVCICIYVYVYIYMYMNIYICIYVGIHIYTCHTHACSHGEWVHSFILVIVCATPFLCAPTTTIPKVRVWRDSFVCVPTRRAKL